jgi:multiple sugar transport system substrate-binding protein
VQIAYSETEGYVPVTKKAQESDEYREYLSLEGTDGDEHYEVKIKAAKLLLANTENTFVTPVFNGSASVRDAAGQLIENVTKSVKRKKTVDDEFIDTLYKDVKSLYHLDQGGANKSLSGKKDLGKLPRESVVFLTILVLAWVIIGAFWIREKVGTKDK